MEFTPSTLISIHLFCDRLYFVVCTCSSVLLWMPRDLARHSYAYFHNLPQDDLPYIKIPLHTVIKLTPRAYGCDEERCVWATLAASYFLYKHNDLDILFPLGLWILIDRSQRRRAQHLHQEWARVVNTIQKMHKIKARALGDG